MTIQLFLGDCLDILPTLADESVDSVICDPPYGTTQNKWDSLIPLDLLWPELRRVTKKTSKIIVMAAQPFASTLIMSNPKEFRYELIWDKVLSVGFLDANRKPLKRHENIIVFYRARGIYNPQKTPGEPYKRGKKALTPTYGAFEQYSSENVSGDRFPTSIVQISNANRNKKWGHPTQKPIELMEYLVKTYTNPGDVVLDFAMGSATTGEACLNLGRSFIGIDKELKYYDIARERLHVESEPVA